MTDIKRECKTCKNPYCSRTLEERQKTEVQVHTQYGWECCDKEKFLQNDGGYVLIKKKELIMTKILTAKKYKSNNPLTKYMQKNIEERFLVYHEDWKKFEQELCRDCEGTGKILGKTCKHCNGAGYINVKLTNQFNYCGYCGTPLNKQPKCPKCGRINK